LKELKFIIQNFRNFQEAHLKIKNVIASIQQQRDENFDDIWEDILDKSNDELKIKDQIRE